MTMTFPLFISVHTKYKLLPLYAVYVYTHTFCDVKSMIFINKSFCYCCFKMKISKAFLHGVKAVPNLLILDKAPV